MSLLFDDASEECLYNNGNAPVTAVPLTLAGWFNSNDLTNTGVVLSVADYDSEDWESFQLEANASNYLRALTLAGGGTAAATSSTIYSVDTWHHGCAVFAAADDRSVYLDGGSKGTNLDSSTPSGIDAVAVGAVLTGSWYQNAISGRAAEAGIWNAALNDAEVAALAKGYSPQMIRPQSLVFYVPIIRAKQDIVGGLSLTTRGSPSVEVHPRVIYPAPPIFYMKESAAVGDLSIDVSDGVTTGESITASLGDLGVSVDASDPAYQGTGVKIVS